MNDVLRRATLLLSTCGLLAAGAATASPPDPGQSILPSRIYLVGSTFGVVDVDHGQFSVVVKNNSGGLLDNVKVEIDFSNSCNTKVCASQLDATVDCSQGRVYKNTVDGLATFTITGGGVGGRCSPTAVVWADDVLLGTVPVSCFDIVLGGVTSTDLGAWIDDWLSLENPGRSDYLAPFNLVNSSDLSKFIEVFFALGSLENCVAPSGACP